MIGWLLNLINPLSRILDTIDRKVSSDTERERLRNESVQAFIAGQVAVINGSGRWLMNFIGFGFALHAFSVCIYSIFFCRSCMMPVDWTIAALPPPFDEWEGVIIMSFFVYFTAQRYIGRAR